MEALWIVTLLLTAWSLMGLQATIDLKRGE
jgi:hypothetical protein